jgi:hypothetical protein
MKHILGNRPAAYIPEAEEDETYPLVMLLTI